MQITIEFKRNLLLICLNSIPLYIGHATQMITLRAKAGSVDKSVDRQRHFCGFNCLLSLCLTYIDWFYYLQSRRLPEMFAVVKLLLLKGDNGNSDIYIYITTAIISYSTLCFMH